MSEAGTTTEQHGDTGETYCYVHTKTPTKLACSRCGNPICGRCAIPATVGQHCPDCVAQAKKSQPKVKNVMAARAPVVMALIAINGIMFFAQFAFPGFTERLVQQPVLIADGELYRLFTAMFLHSESSLLHILFNMYILYSYGPFVEQFLGRGRFIALYVLAGLAGSAASFMFSSPGASSLGASGAIFGVAGALLVFAFHARGSAAGAQFMRGILLFVGINLLFGFTVGGIDNNAHLGGLIGGIVITAGLMQNTQRMRPTGIQVVTFAIAAALVLGMIVYRIDDLKQSLGPNLELIADQIRRRFGL